MQQTVNDLEIIYRPKKKRAIKNKGLSLRACKMRSKNAFPNSPKFARAEWVKYGVYIEFDHCLKDWVQVYPNALRNQLTGEKMDGYLVNWKPSFEDETAKDYFLI